MITLCENRLEPNIGLRASHGLSIYFKYGQRNILYDVGQDDTFRHNAEVLGVDLSMCDRVVISHGHVDHAGGLPFLDGLVAQQNVVIHEKAFQERRRLHDGQEIDIGIAPGHCGLRPIMPRQSHQLEEGIWLLVNSDAEGATGLEKGLYVKDSDGNLKDDLFEDELSLAFETPRGLVIASGCSHGGPTNIVREGLKASGSRRVYAFIGGLHLTFGEDEEIWRELESLRSLDIGLFVIGHCTGLDALFRMRRQVPNGCDVVSNFVGLSRVI